MRDPKRIDEFCKTLATIWKTNCPDWRFGQLVCNVFGAYGRDPFFLEEADTIKLFEEYFGITHYEGTNT